MSDIKTQFYHDAIAGFLNENGSYSLSLQQDNDGVPVLALSHGEQNVDLDMLNIYEQCAYLIKQHEKNRILAKYREWGLEAMPFDAFSDAKAYLDDLAEKGLLGKLDD